jgi:hypothetical protein
MGWAHGINNEGREVGYGVSATCDEEGCNERIDRGIAYVCGGMHDGGNHGCGRYFCGEHLYFVNRPEKVRANEESGQLCGECAGVEAWKSEA